MSGSKFSAADAALGYAYQVRTALVRALELARKGLQFDVAVETLDDVSFTTGGDAFELLQLKHSLHSHAGLTDSSPSIWKTLRIWCAKQRAGKLQNDVKLFLVTTSLAPLGTAASFLKASSKDVAKAQTLLNDAASTSLNKDNASGYAEWKSLKSGEQLTLLKHIEVVDGSPNIIDLEEQLLNQLWGFVEKDQRSAFLEYLEGWWFARVLRQLAGKAPFVPVAEIEAQLDKLREQFRTDNLPIDEALLTQQLNSALVDSYKSYVFVRQLELVRASEKRISFAIRDYFRAYEQRSKWVRQDLVLDTELEGYEERLIEEWEIAREQLLPQIGPEATEEALLEVGLSLLTWAENSLIHIRNSVTTQFVCRGSLHMLSDEQRVGWHPRFVEKLGAILQIKASATA